MLNKVKLAYDLGYRIINGNAISKKGKCLKPMLTSTGYRSFSIRLPVATGQRKTCRIAYHRLVAYQKYGDNMFAPSVIVRHHDGDCLNNLDDNILIGTPSDNMMDQTLQVRRAKSIKASTVNRVLTDEEVTRLKEDRFVHGLTYSQLATKYCIGHKGHAHYIANHEYVTKKTTHFASVAQE